MSLQRRLLLSLLLCAPLLWAAALGLSIVRARHEVNELYDTQMVLLARQVLGTVDRRGADAAPPAAAMAIANAGDSKIGDLALTVRDREGRVLVADHGRFELPAGPPRTGFVDLVHKRDAWRVYYRSTDDGAVQVAVGQKSKERREMVLSLTLSQLLPWLLMLPLLLAALAWAVRRAFAPLRQLTDELGQRHADDLRPLAAAQAPAELKPMLDEMNHLFGRIEATLAHERRFTADAAHELRTPLAVLRAQWDVVRRASDPAERAAAERKLGGGFERLERLVTQMLALSRLDSAEASVVARQPVAWPAIVEQAISDCLPLAERRHIELACDWPASAEPLPLCGDPELLAVMLRNLLDNAARYADAGTTVLLRFDADRIEVDNEGTPLTPEALARLGERFQRPAGQVENGSGLGLSIVKRIAAMHALRLSVGNHAHGVRATLSRAVPGAARELQGRTTDSVEEGPKHA